jgi:hypothetical protein
VRPCYAFISSYQGAAFNAAMLCELQHSPCDIATFYDAQVKQHESWCGLFAPTLESSHAKAGQVELKKGYYAFKAFGVLAQSGQEAFSKIEEGNVYVCAATGDSKAVMLVNFHDAECVNEQVTVKLVGAEDVPMKILRLDEETNLTQVGEIRGEGVINLPPYSVVLLTER